MRWESSGNSQSILPLCGQNPPTSHVDGRATIVNRPTDAIGIPQLLTIVQALITSQSAEPPLKHPRRRPWIDEFGVRSKYSFSIIIWNIYGHI